MLKNYSLLGAKGLMTFKPSKETWEEPKVCLDLQHKMFL
jgi:hypothetical protein